ncbi:GNAT family N-acetyltransferase [Roseomonas xinghualingensis]|uniref:GNAT family N-acetyltransferase n=1 Tax=Roseomonas xinghualingensis TaxID=2986475 RepID=UPI0021F1CA95|nr:GNAT family N-acetyltransferase [Roseomonas sp. SXEYE001]MCV4208641.1 GNAT family N-acetyltransferase [Roseomonas sp. SXEYE001]
MSIRLAQAHNLPPGFPDLRNAALAEGWKLLRVLEEDWNSGTLRFDAAGEGLFAVWRDDTLAGMVGLSVDPYADQKLIARLRRLYVAPPHRGLGLGRALVEAAVQAAEEHGFRMLRVRAPAVARPFYEACGFLPAVMRSATHIRPL